MPDNPFEPMIKNIGDYVSGTLYAQGVIPPIGIVNYEGLALSSPADTHLLAAKDPVIDEIAVGMTGNEIKGEYVTGTPPLTLSDSEGYPLQWWQVNLSPYQEGTGDPAPDNVRPIHGTDKVTLWTSGVNMCDPDGFTAGKYVRAGNPSESQPLGSEVASQYWSCTDYILVKPSTVYTQCLPAFQNASGAGLVFYADKTVASAISGVSATYQGNAIYTFTTPATCKYVRISWNNNAVPTTEYTNPQLTASNTALPYEPYQGTQTVITLPATGKNLLNIDAGTHNAWAFVNIPNNLQPDTEYTFSLSGNTGYTYTLYLGNSIQSTRPLSQAITGGGSSTFTTPANMSGEPFLAIAGDVSGAGNEPIASLLPQIELGSSATAYEAYTNTIYSGQVYTGGAVSSVKMINAKDINWNFSQGTVFCTPADLYKTISPDAPTGRKPMWCNIAKYTANTYTAIGEIGYGGINNNGNIVFYNPSVAPDLATWRQYIADNDVLIYYPLSTPTTITLTTPPIPTPKGNATTWATAEDGIVDSMVAIYIKSE